MHRCTITGDGCCLSTSTLIVELKRRPGDGRARRWNASVHAYGSRLRWTTARLAFSTLIVDLKRRPGDCRARRWNASVHDYGSRLRWTTARLAFSTLIVELKRRPETAEAHDGNASVHAYGSRLRWTIAASLSTGRVTESFCDRSMRNRKGRFNRAIGEFG
jgi:hypothetical protein